jgi:hypothetical protein
MTRPELGSGRSVTIMRMIRIDLQTQAAWPMSLSKGSAGRERQWQRTLLRGRGETQNQCRSLFRMAMPGSGCGHPPRQRGPQAPADQSGFKCRKATRDRKSTRLNSSHNPASRMPSSA